MRTLGVILIVLALGGAGLGAYGHMMMDEAKQTIETNTNELRTRFPGLEEEADLTSIQDLVAIDRILKASADPSEQDLAWDILDAMGDEEEGEQFRLIGFAAGGGLLLVGLLLVALGGKKKSATGEA